MTWFLRNWDQVAIALGQHVTISLTALVIAFAIALPVGIAAARNDLLRVRLSVGAGRLNISVSSPYFWNKPLSCASQSGKKPGVGCG